jgi:streptogramin lyase
MARSPLSLLAGLLPALTAALLTGCGSGGNPMSNPAPPPPPPGSYLGPSFSVDVLAAGKPIAGAQVQFLAAGSTGNGLAPTALLTTLPTTGASGAATIPATYGCPSASSFVYLVAAQGTVAGSSSPNQNIFLLTAIGTCGSIQSGSRFTLNEATTVAGVAALHQFLAPGGLIGASATNANGLGNAFATASTIADPVSGAAPGSSLPGNAVLSSATVNSLANLLNACIISAPACSTLYSTVGNSSGAPADTLEALRFIFDSPANQVEALFTQSQSSAAYQPALARAPSDWTLFETLSGGGLDSPTGIGVDSTGAVWVANYFNVASKFSPLGAPVFADGISGYGLNNSYGLAIDMNNNAWIPNQQPLTGSGIGSVSEFSPNGSSLAGNGFVNGGMNYPIALAIDPNGTVWVVDYGNSALTLLDSSGAPLSGQIGYTSATLAVPVSVAVDSHHFGWVGDLSDTVINKVSPDGTFTPVDCCDGAYGIALDQQNNVWVANYYGNSVSLVSESGTVLSNGGFNAADSLDHPQAIAVDGAGNIWVANFRAPYLSELAGSQATIPGAPLTPVTGVGANASLLEAIALAIDASGNVWVSNEGSDTVTKFIGLARTVKTPLSGNPVAP